MRAILSSKTRTWPAATRGERAPLTGTQRLSAGRHYCDQGWQGRWVAWVAGSQNVATRARRGRGSLKNVGVALNRKNCSQIYAKYVYIDN